MAGNKIRDLYEKHGQSLWYDNIARDLLENGAIQALVDEGVRGLTSNPSIFQKAITSGTAYDDQIRTLAAQGKSPQEIYEALAIDDIRRAADMLRPIYESSAGADGYVSLEVSPLLANDTQGTIAEAARLWRAVDRPNLMIKIPATEAGLPAIEQSLADGINVNVTLIFSREMYSRVIDAYIRGLQRRAAAGQDVSRVASVASFFVSRVDTLVDDLLEHQIAAADDPAQKGRLEALKGKAAIANAKLAYQLFKQKFSGAAWEALAAQGARVQRPLWASTSTKNPAYSDVLYVDNLIGPYTINTAPPETIAAFRDHGVLADTLEADIEGARRVMEELAAVGIDMDAVTAQLLEEGIDKFAKPFLSLLEAIGQKAQALSKAPAV